MNTNATECLYNAMLSACNKDLPLIEFNTKNDPFPRRPLHHEVRVIMFPQAWGDTSLGYGGIGGQAFTEAYTVIVFFENHYCVYFGSGGNLAYRIDIDIDKLPESGCDKFFNDIRDQSMRGKWEMSKYHVN